MFHIHVAATLCSEMAAVTLRGQSKNIEICKNRLTGGALLMPRKANIGAEVAMASTST